MRSSNIELRVTDRGARFHSSPNDLELESEEHLVVTSTHTAHVLVNNRSGIDTELMKESSSGPLTTE